MAPMAPVCAGCGAEGIHPMVGVYRDEETGQHAAAPVCEACWRDPAHRTKVLKMHFFPRAQADEAVRKAGSRSLGGG